MVRVRTGVDEILVAAALGLDELPCMADILLPGAAVVVPSIAAVKVVLVLPLPGIGMSVWPGVDVASVVVAPADPGCLIIQ